VKGIYMRSKYFYGVLIAVFFLIYRPISGSCADTWKTNNPVDQDLNAIWGFTGEDIYAAGANNTLLHYDGSSWEQVSQFKAGTTSLLSLWGVPPVPIIATDDLGDIFLNDGLRWVKYPPIRIGNLNALWGSATTNIYAVGSSGTILSFNGASWRLISPAITSVDLYSIWGSSADNILVGGYLGKLFHYNGLAWESVSLGSITSQDIRAIWGSSGLDVYATGSYGDILHYDGSTWKIVAANSGVRLNTLWGSAADDVFAAGENGSVYHYDGVAWNRLETSSLVDINAAWGSTSGTVYFACKNGQILTYARDDHIPPVINYSELSKDNNGKVYISTPVTFHFSERMKDSTLNSTTIILKSGSTIIPGNITLSSDKMTIAVSGDLAYSTAYIVTITGGSSGVKDIAGNALKSDYSVSFTIESEPSNVPGTGNGKSGCFISSARL
jgi:hypothetical protein